MLTEIHTESVHFPKKPLWSAEQVQRLETLLVAGQAAALALVALPVDVLIALPALARLLDLVELVTVGGFGHVTLGDAGHAVLRLGVRLLHRIVDVIAALWPGQPYL